MIDIKMLYWAAGFLEGEGHFGVHSRDSCPVIECDQKLNGPIKRLHKLFGGSVTVHRARHPNPTKKEPLFHWRWRITGNRAAGLMMTLYPIMCLRRRRRIYECLAAWRSTRDFWYWKRRAFENVRQPRKSLTR